MAGLELSDDELASTAWSERRRPSSVGSVPPRLAACRAFPNPRTRSSGSSTPRWASTGGSGPTTSPVARPRADARRRRDHLGRATATRCSPRSTRSRPSSRRAASRSCPTTRTSTWRSSGGSPRSPARSAGTLHTARSRNDQVATDVALFTRDAAGTAAQGDARRSRATLVDVAERHLDWPLPGYTHLQRAQPVYLAHHLLAYVWMLAARPRADALRRRADGDAPARRGRAGRGELRDRPRRRRRASSASRGVAPNSIDAVSNRDFVLDYLSAASTCATHLSPPRRGDRALGERGVRLRHAERRVVDGSSIMPQKKNPDAAELLRAKAPRIVAHHAALLGVMHALPLTYNKDLQEDKEHLFDAVDTLELCLAAAAGMLATRDVPPRADGRGGERRAHRRDRRRRPARPQGRPVPRARHGVVAGLVRLAVDSGRTLSRAHRRGAARRVARARPRDARRGPRAALVAGVEGLGGRHLARARPRAARRRAARALEA